MSYLLSIRELKSLSLKSSTDKITLSMLHESINVALWPRLIHMSPHCNRHWTNTNIRQKYVYWESDHFIVPIDPIIRDKTKYSQRSPVLVLTAAKTLFSVARNTFLDDCTCVSKWENRTLPIYCCLLWITREEKLWEGTQASLYIFEQTNACITTDIITNSNKKKTW